MWNLFGYPAAGSLRRLVTERLASPFISFHYQPDSDLLFCLCQNGDLVAYDVQNEVVTPVSFLPRAAEQACSLLGLAPSVWQSAGWQVEKVVVESAGPCEVCAVVTTRGGHRVYCLLDRASRALTVAEVRVGCPTSEPLRSWRVPGAWVQVAANDAVRVLYPLPAFASAPVSPANPTTPITPTTSVTPTVDACNTTSDITTPTRDATQMQRQRREAVESLERCGLGVQEVCVGVDGVLLLGVGQLTLVRPTTAEECGATLGALPLRDYLRYAQRASELLGDADHHSALYEVLAGYCKMGAVEALRALEYYQNPEEVSVLLRCVRQ